MLKIHPQDPEKRKIEQVVDQLRAGKVIVCPTDSVYAYVCSSADPRAIEQLAKLKGTRPEKVDLSLICEDLTQASHYTRQLGTPVFRAMKRCLPGPFTFILPASGEVPKLFKNKKRTVGIRIPDHAIPLALVRGLGHPLVASSVHGSDVFLEHTADPAEIEAEEGHRVDLVIDGGLCGLEGSTVVDATGPGPVVVREGAGDAQLVDQ
ncbi:MAG: threonylcarbamoyl-AMP synthase [Flavobacteriales bacterium]|nr:threonylcarbamoyl-AMP synthase [Flavobacteriales bacterium]